MKKILLTGFIGLLAFGSAAFAEIKYDSDLKSDFIEMYHSYGLPIQSDEITALVDVHSGKNENVVHYKYEIDVDGLKKMLKAENPRLNRLPRNFMRTMGKFVNRELIVTDCDPDSNEIVLLKNGISFDYRYYSAQTKEELFHFTRTIDDCKK